MIGSLVIVYPTQHEGGSLVLRHGDKEWVFDSGRALADLQQPSIAYVAFFSDVEHEVAPVQKGYRVTLTYNLYARDTAPILPRSLSNHITNERASAFKNVLKTLLDDVSFFPQGGLLGFGLFHQYPVDTRNIKNLTSTRLKGRDAILYTACKDLGLHVRTTFFYEYSGDTVLGDEIDEQGMNFCEESIRDYMYPRDGLVLSPQKDKNEYIVDKGCVGRPPMVWITKPLDLNEYEQPLIAYGNEEAIDYCYGYGCFYVEIGQPGERSKRLSAALDKRRF